MDYQMPYPSPMGTMTLACDETGLTGAWFDGQKYFGSTLSDQTIEQAHPILVRTAAWLDRYFGGEKPKTLPPLHVRGSEFRKLVWELLLHIPYGQVVTYGDLAKQMARKMDKHSMSAQAIGGAVGHNPISILIPCHRVIGADGSVTGYAGGVERKMALLRWEGASGWKPVKQEE